MTAEEQEVNDCLNKVFAYCKKHKTCVGCIFYRSINFGNMVAVGYCRITYAPDVFGDSQNGK